MNKNNQIYTSLDIGTSSIKVIIAEYINGEMNIIGVGEEESKGIKKGVIVDIDKTVQSIQTAIAQAESKASFEVRDVIVGIPAYGLDIEYSHGVVKVSDDQGEIKEQDIHAVLEQAMVQTVSPEKELMTVLVDEFSVDGFDDITDPRGMVGLRLEMHALLLTLPKTMIHSIKRCVNMAGLNIQELVLQPLALASTALSREQRHVGAVIMDMGGGQTTVSAIHDNQLKFSFVDPEGGDFVTRDIAYVLNTSQATAEKIKRHYGYALATAADPTNLISIEKVGQMETEEISEDYLAAIIEARETQILETVKSELDKIQALELPGGVVVTGGNSSVPEMEALIEDVFEKNVEFYTPNYMSVRYPTFSTAVGLIQYVYEQEEIQTLLNQFVNGTYVQEQRSSSVQKENKKIKLPIKEEPKHREEQVSYDRSEVETKRKRESTENLSFIDKIKAMFSNFFNFDD